jgi:hypothetical protein
MQEQSSSQPTSSSQPPIQKKYSTKLEEIISISTGISQANPIILVFPQITPGSLSLENAKDFLDKGV